MSSPKKAFIIHGATISVLREINRLVDVATSVDAIVLGEDVHGVRSLIDRYAAPHDPRSVVIALLTGDDVGRTGSESHGALMLRPSQQVVFGLGYFLGLLPASHVIVLCQEDVVGPSEIEGVEYLFLGDEAWPIKLARSLERLGATVDYTKIDHG